MYLFGMWKKRLMWKAICWLPSGWCCLCFMNIDSLSQSFIYKEYRQQHYKEYRFSVPAASKCYCSSTLCTNKEWFGTYKLHNIIFWSLYVCMMVTGEYASLGALVWVWVWECVWGECVSVEVETDGWSGDLGEGGEAGVALEAKLAGKAGPREVAHVRAVVDIVISAQQKEWSVLYRIQYRVWLHIGNGSELIQYMVIYNTYLIHCHSWCIRIYKRLFKSGPFTHLLTITPLPVDVSIAGVPWLSPPLYVELSLRVIYQSSIGGTGGPVWSGRVLYIPHNVLYIISSPHKPLLIIMCSIIAMGVVLDI